MRYLKGINENVNFRIDSILNDIDIIDDFFETLKGNYKGIEISFHCWSSGLLGPGRYNPLDKNDFDDFIMNINKIISGEINLSQIPTLCYNITVDFPRNISDPDLLEDFINKNLTLRLNNSDSFIQSLILDKNTRLERTATKSKGYITNKSNKISLKLSIFNKK